MIRANVKTIAEPTGPLLFFGGVYSNLQALEALKAWADEHSFRPGNIFCTGDIMGYCAQPVECLQLIKDWGIRAIAGNVELQVRNNENHCGCDFKSGGRCDLFSRNWYTYIQQQITEEARAWLHTLPEQIQFRYANKCITVLHGSWFHTSEFIFESTPWERKAQNFAASSSDVIIAGHCGIPFAQRQEGKLWANAGVIGMPANDGTDRVWFLSLHPQEAKGVDFRFHSLRYNNVLASKLMRERGLPLSYADTLLTGIWDNCEILPATEASKQGEVITI